jgi:adenylyltransferase/sulfurtransferase
MRFREMKLRKNPECPVCGTHPTLTELIDYDEFCGVGSGPQVAHALQNGIPQISVKELKGRLDAGEDFVLLDVREPYEFQIAQIGGRLIPLNELPQRLGELERGREIVVHCRSGVRGQRAAELLRANGFERVSNVAGGILAWSDEIDSRVQKY